MAQADGSFLYQLKLQLQDDAAVASMGQQLQAVETRVRQIESGAVGADKAIESMGIHAQDLTKAFARPPGAVNDLRQQLIRSDNALEEVAAQGVKTWDGVERGALQASDATQNIRKDLIRASNAQEELNQAAARSNSQFTKTSQTSQNLLRIMQDAQFGAIGVANNVQALGESLGRASSRGRTALQQLWLGLKNLVAGPFALPAIITGLTLVAQNWDTVKGKAMDALEFIGMELDRTGEKVDDFADKVDKVVGFDDIQKTIVSGIRDIEDEDLFKRIDKQFRRTQANALRLGLRLSQLKVELDAASTQVPETAQELEFLSETEKEAIEATRNLRTQVNLFSKTQNNLTQQLTALEAIQKATNAESIRELRIRRHLIDLMPQNIKLAKDIARRISQEQKAAEERNQQIEYELRLRELQIEANKNAMESEFQSIQLSLDKRRQEIRQLEISIEKRERLLDLLNQIERQQREAQVEESQVEAAPLEGENRIMLPDGRMVDPDDFIEQQKSVRQRALKELQADRDALRAEREIGDQGGFFQDFGMAQLDFQMDMLQQEEKLRKKRIQNQIKFLREKKRLAMAQGDTDAFADAISGIARLEKKKYQIEKKWKEKRLSLQLQHLKQMSENIRTGGVAGATQDLVFQLGSIWSAFEQDKIELQGKSFRKQVQIIGELGGELVGAAANISEQMFQSWKSNRKKQLENEGKSQEQQRKILKEEGKKRFRLMKAMKMAEASIHTASAVTKALDAAPPPINFGLAATVGAMGLARIAQIANMSIGDRISGGGAGAGGGPAGGEFTQFNQSAAARRAADFGARRRAERQENETDIDKVAEKVGREVANNMPDEVTMGRRTAGEAQRVGTDINNKFIK